MNIDASIVRDYLNGKGGYEKHWIFRSIKDNDEFYFERPSEDDKLAVSKAMHDVIRTLEDFQPYNIALFNKLFTDWRKLSASASIILAVGCPAPYDAMVRAHDGREFIILDLIRLLDYGIDMEKLIRPFLTHELVHICVHADHPNMLTACGYRERLINIVFDEGFAHLLAFRDNIYNVDFAPLIEKHYQGALNKLGAAIAEKEPEKQATLLNEANAGAYWEKFGAICGKLFLAMHLDDIESIYNAGSEELFKRIATDAQAFVRA